MRILFIIIFLLNFCSNIVLAQHVLNSDKRDTLLFSGQLSAWSNYNHNNTLPLWFGGRYIPQVNYNIELTDSRLLDFEFSTNINGSAGLDLFDSSYTDGNIRPYRAWAGEEKKHLYKTLIYEGILIGAIGSVTGTMIGIGISYYLQEVGIDISGSLKNSSLMMPSVVRASITPTAFYIGFIPGLFSMVLGNALSGIGIYKRKTANLFKELEV